MIVSQDQIALKIIYLIFKTRLRFGSGKKFWIRRQTSFDFVFGKLSAAAKQILRQMKALPVKDQSLEDQSGTGEFQLPSYLKAVCYHSLKYGGDSIA